MDNNEKKSLNLEIRPEIGRGTYSNLAIIVHSQNEFIVDFASMLPGLAKPEITNRIVMTPVNAKRLMYALMDNMSKYESQFGTIQLEEQNNQQQEEKGSFNLGDFVNNGGTKS